MAKAPRSKNWIWFFGILAVLAAAALTLSLAFNLRQQLKLEDVVQAKKLWQSKGPADYVLEYTKILESRGSDKTTNQFVVTVRKGRTVAVVLKQKSPGLDDAEQSLPARQYSYYGMDALFDDLEALLEQDAKPGRPRTFNRAIFDSQDGHLIHFTRSISAEGVRLEIRVTRLEQQRSAP